MSARRKKTDGISCCSRHSLPPFPHQRKLGGCSNHLHRPQTTPSSLGKSRAQSWPGRISCHNFSRSHVLGHHTSRSNDRFFSNCYSAKDSCPGTDRCAFPYPSVFTLPIRFALQTSLIIRCTRKPIVDEGDPVANEHFVLNRHPFANKGVAGNFTSGANPGAFLNLNKCADFGVVTNRTTIQIREGKDLDPLAELHIRGYALVKLIGITHAANTLRSTEGTATPTPWPFPFACPFPLCPLVDPFNWFSATPLAECAGNPKLTA